ncbi:ribonuclease HI family protein [Candidatus Dojkabacteria bacterium]|uniref:Ribonuclease HI family protein n=1 Tax=Candidatus Dojkabacteria bacterium TaxID=2099670 RepID=A0A955L9Q8_9BACT|nr:ribonuclease HI family protein [Candidatus Dojkabacteria bacterium]
MYKLFTDGGARGNPGPAAIGAFIFDNEDNLAAFDGKYLGEATNNEAEYNALILGLTLANKEGIKEIDCFLDSELVVKQLNGQYLVKQEHLQKLKAEVQDLVFLFEKIAIHHVPREQNKHADRMVNVILDSIQ